MSTFLQDVKFALRGFGRSPAFALVAVVTLALGIGANTAIFSVVDAAILRPLPYPDAGALAELKFMKNGQDGAVSIPDYRDWRDQSKSFTELAAWHYDSAVLTGRAQPVQLDSAAVSANIFRVLGVQPALGRGFAAEEDTPGKSDVVVLSHETWSKHFGADPQLIGKTITLDGAPVTVIGVLPEGFRFVGANGAPSVFLPMPRGPDEAMATHRGAHFLMVDGRLRAGVTVEQAGQELGTIGARLAAEYPKTNTGSTVRVLPLQESVVAGFRPALLVLLAAVGFVLLIACANVANILLARATVRQRELAVRVALGASRGRIVRQLLTESLLLAFAGGAAGVVLAVWGLDALKTILPGDLSRMHAIAVDGRVLAFTIGICVVTGVAFGLVPALHAAGANPHDALSAASTRTTGGGVRQRVRSVLVAGEVAAAMLLLVGAGLMLRSFWRLSDVNPGFDPSDLTVAQLTLPDSRYDTPEKLATFYRTLRGKLAALPGAQTAFAIDAPFTNTNLWLTFDVIGAPPAAAGNERLGAFNSITADAFATLRLPIRAGRAFTDAEDRPEGPGYALISETLARRYFSAGDALGKKITVGWRGDRREREIIGIVADIHSKKLEAEPEAVMYFPMSQAPSTFFAIIVRTPATAGLAEELRRAVAGVDSDQPVADITPMSQLLKDVNAQRRLSTLLLGIFGAIALLLALIGVYGVMSYNVTQRVHEIGVRMALGARPGDVTRMVVRNGALVALAGVAAGVALTLPLARLMGGMLFGVGAADPVTYVAIAGALLVVAVLASWLPARRAARVDPMVALRAE